MAPLPPRCGFLDRALPTLMSLSKPRASRPLNSTGEPSRGSGVDCPRIIATIAASFVIAFKERSIRYQRENGGQSSQPYLQ